MADVVERVKGKHVVKPIVYGNTATPFGYKRESDNHTHSWTVFLKPYYNEDPSRYIRKVQFKLHDSIPNSTRVVEQPPYEVTETGWGEFEVQIRIFFHDVNEKPVTAFHYLRLFQPVVALLQGGTMVVAEYYDELVFQEPTQTMFALLGGESGAKRPANKTFHNDLMANRRRCVELVRAARDEAAAEIEDLRESLRAAHKLMLQHRGDEGEEEEA